MSREQDRATRYQEGSLTLPGTVMLGTGVMIGAGIFALTGQMAQMTGALFPLAFLVAAVVTSFSAYSYIKISNAWPSAGGIGMYLHKAYGNRLPTAFNALLMYFSMVIAQSFLARTFGSYTMQLFGGDESGHMVPILGVALIIAAFLVNLLGNRMVQGVASFIGILKIGGILIFGLVGIWVADSISIVISIAACVVIYTLVGFAVASNLSLAEIIETRDYSLAAAARPALGEYAVWFTIALAMMATAGGILASIFAVSRMLAMLTEMKLVPHRHFGMPGSIQKHTLVYTVVLGVILTAFFDLSRIAALGIVFYLIMDIAIHWGVLRYLRKDIKANVWVPTVAILLDLLALGGFVWVKLNTDPLVIGVAVGAMLVIAVAELIFLKQARELGRGDSHAHHHH